MASRLNPAQREAVRHVDGPLLVLAGAGSGKTSVIVEKIRHLIRSGYDPASITAVTFTNKAAREMRDRVAAGQGAAPAISTFHRLGMNLLRTHHKAAGLKRSFSLLGPDDSAAVIADLARADLAADRGIHQAIAGAISSFKNRNLDHEAVLKITADGPVEQAAQRIMGEYRRRLRAINAVDIDDLILEPARLLREYPDIRRAVRAALGYLLVDEYQDTNAAQYDLVRALVGTGTAFTVVGDDDQSIYAWRGADPGNMARLSRDFADLRIVKLEQNYRSSGRILKVANAVIAHNSNRFEKNLWSERGYGDQIRVLVGRDEPHEADRVVSAIMHRQFQQRDSFGDYAILYRGNHQSRMFETRLREMRIPYVISGTKSLFDRAEVRDLMAYMRLVCNPDDDAAFLRVVNVPRRGIGAGTLEKLVALADESAESLSEAAGSTALEQVLPARQFGPLRHFAGMMMEFRQRTGEAAGPLFGEIIEQTGYREWLEQNFDTETAGRKLANIQEVENWVERLGRRDGADFADVAADILLAGMLNARDDEDADAGQLRLMTVHSAKGLEFDHVFLSGVEEGLMPHQSSIDQDQVEEERRLFYVAVTRARKTLTLSMASSRRRFGEVASSTPSRFLDEMPADDLDWDRPDEQARKPGLGQAHLAAIRGTLGS